MVTDFAVRVPEELALLADALLGAPGRRLALLPAGEATADVVATRTVSSGTGEPAEIRLVEIGGLGFAPSHLWLDADGFLFAQVSPWFAVVREGFAARHARLSSLRSEMAQHFGPLAA